MSRVRPACGGDLLRPVGVGLPVGAARGASASQKEADDGCGVHRACHIRKCVGWVPGTFNGSGDNPKSMGLPNHKKAEARHASFVGISLAGMPVRPSVINRRLASVIEDSERQRPRSVLAKWTADRAGA